MKIPKKDMKKWIAALRSGKYKQAKGELQNEKGYCCLGVACKVLISENKQYKIDGFLGGGLPDTQPDSPDWLKCINGKTYTSFGETLTVANDNLGYTFKDIADTLEDLYIHEYHKD